MYDGQESLDSLGTFAAPVTLTASFTDNVGKSLLCRYRKHLSLRGFYTPATTNAYIVILLEKTNDFSTNGPAANSWVQFGVLNPSAQEVEDFTDSGTDMGSVQGIPIVVPGDKTSTIGALIPIEVELDINAAAWVRVKAIEFLPTGSAFGTANIELTVIR